MNAQPPPGGQADAYDERPWEQPGAVRRDCEAHRASELRFVAELAFWLGLLSFCWLPGLPAVACGSVVYFLASNDLAMMKAGKMDPAGRHTTEMARKMAIVGVLVPSIWWAFCGLMLLVVIIGR